MLGLFLSLALTLPSAPASLPAQTVGPEPAAAPPAAAVSAAAPGTPVPSGEAKAAAPARAEPATGDSSTTTADEGAIPGAAAGGRTARRPTLTDEEYRQLAAHLRESYARPPAEWPTPEVDEPERFQEIGTLPKMTYPEDNPPSQPKVDLGRDALLRSPAPPAATRWLARAAMTRT